jgi:hypothetical protein
MPLSSPPRWARTRLLQLAASAVGVSIVAAVGLPALVAAATGPTPPSAGPAAGSDPATWTGQTTRVYQVPARIAADCSKDVANELNRWIQRIPSGTTIQFAKNGCYETEETVLFRDLSDIVVDGQGSVFKRKHLSPLDLQWPISNPHFLFANMTHLVVKNINVQGTNMKSDVPGVPQIAAYDPRFEFESGFNIEGSTDVRLEKSTTVGTWGDGVYISGKNQWSGNASSHVTVQEMTVYKNGRGGIVITYASHILIADVTIAWGRRSGINMEPNFWDAIVSYVEIRNSNITARFPAFDAAGSGSVNKIFIHDNTIPIAGIPFIYDKATDGHPRKDWTVRDNDVLGFLGSPMPGMLFANTTGVVVTHNVIPFAAERHMWGVGLINGSTGAKVHCNWFKNASASVALDRTSSATRYGNALQSLPPDCRRDPREAVTLGSP